MNEKMKHKLIWGWLRLLLAGLQMSFVAATVGALLAVGQRPVTFVFLGLATAATAISLLIYRRRADPRLQDTGTAPERQR